MRSRLSIISILLVSVYYNLAAIIWLLKLYNMPYPTTYNSFWERRTKINENNDWTPKKKTNIETTSAKIHLIS